MSLSRREHPFTTGYQHLETNHSNQWHNFIMLATIRHSNPAIPPRCRLDSITLRMNTKCTIHCIPKELQMSSIKMNIGPLQLASIDPIL